MKKLCTYILSALSLTAGLLTTACTTDSSIDPAEGTGSGSTTIQLGAKVEGLDTQTKATGVIDYHVLSTTGFGVYAYGLTDGNWYNKEVTFLTTPPADNPSDLYFYPYNWSYWGAGKPTNWADQTISFYAYAPYGTNGCVSTLSPTSGTADPALTYTIATTPDQCVDLLWGINGDKGTPWANATAKNTGGPILFTFHHALAALGFHVQAMIDQDNNTDDLTDESKVADLLGESGRYKITVKQLKVEGNFFQSASFNLNSTVSAPTWSGPSGTETALTVGNTLINANFRHAGTEATTTAALAESMMDDDNLDGITQTAQQLLIGNNSATGKEQCFFVIPNTSEQDYTITIDWCISGQAPDNSYIAEDRTSTITVSDLALRAGIKYYFNFVIGLRALRLNVNAQDWENNPVDETFTIERGTSANSSLAPMRKQNRR